MLPTYPSTGKTADEIIADMNYSNLEKTNGSKLIDQIQNNSINRIMCSPGLINIIVEYCIKNNIEIPYKTKIYTGGGAVYLDLIDNIKKVFKKCSINTIYGSSEAEPIAMLNIDDMSEEDIKDTINGKGILAGKIIGVSNCKTIETNKEIIGQITKEEYELNETANKKIDEYLEAIADKYFKKAIIVNIDLPEE